MFKLWGLCAQRLASCRKETTALRWLSTPGGGAAIMGRGQTQTTKGKFLPWMWCTPSQRANTSQLTESCHFVSLTSRSYTIIWKDCTFLTNAAGMGCHAVPKEPMAACCVCALCSGSADCPPRNAAVCEAAVSKIASSEQCDKHIPLWIIAQTTPCITVGSAQTSYPLHFSGQPESRSGMMLISLSYFLLMLMRKPVFPNWE